MINTAEEKPVVPSVGAANGDDSPTDLSFLIDKHYQLVCDKEALEREIKDVAHEITCKLLESGQQQSYGNQGIGYALTSTTRYDFGKAAYRYLEDKGLLSHFVPEPKITKAKLEALQKEGVLTYADLAAIETYTVVEQSPYALRKVVQKEAVL